MRASASADIMSSGEAPLLHRAALSDDQVVITGMGAVTALGNTLQEIWDAVLQGRCGFTRLNGFKADDPRGIAAPVRGLDPISLGVDARDSRIMGTHSYMLMKATRDAFRSSHLESVTIPRDAIAFFAGMGMVDYRVEDLLPGIRKSGKLHGPVDFSLFHAEGYKDIHPLWPLSMLNNISFCQVAIALDIQGENIVFSPHEEAGVAAIAESMLALREGRALMALTAGVSETISEVSLTRAMLSGVLHPGDGCETMREGILGPDSMAIGLGEGCGVVIMELSASARDRGVTPLAVLMGHDSSFQSDPDVGYPSVSAIEACINGALGEARLRPEQIDALILAGSHKSAGDRNELEALMRVFGDRISEIPAFCSKGSMGHTLAGAPLVDLVLAVTMLREGIIPPSLRICREQNSYGVRMVTGSSLEATLRRILVNCRNREGYAASLVLGAFPN